MNRDDKILFIFTSIICVVFFIIGGLIVNSDYCDRRFCANTEPPQTITHWDLLNGNDTKELRECYICENLKDEILQHHKMLEEQ